MLEQGHTHPADDARMTALLEGLTLVNEQRPAAVIEDKWREFLQCSGQKEPAEFHRFYPRAIITIFAEEAHKGFTAMGCQPWAGNNSGRVREVLNEGWRQFWRDPKSYTDWEAKTVASLL